MAVSSSTLDVTTMRSRLDRLRGEASRAGVAATVVAPGSDLRYLIGVGGSSFERLTALVVPSDAAVAPVFVSPALEYAGLGHVPLVDLGVEVRTWVDVEDAYALALGGVPTGRVAVSDLMPALHLLRLRDAGAVDQQLAGPVLRELRMRKDDAELAELRAAGAAIDRVHARVGEWLRAGRTEAAVAADIATAIVEEGHAVAEFVIVGSGPNGASPHHEVSDRVIRAGDPVVVDIGGTTQDGYCSDSTRTYAVGEPPAEFREMYEVLRRAQHAQTDAVRPGITAEELDAVGRDIIAAAGYGEHFIHRTGHGIGLETHEEPYIVAGSHRPLEPGMAFSVEPGIYLPDRFGARIEDIAVCTPEGGERLNQTSRDLVVLSV